LSSPQAADTSDSATMSMTILLILFNGAPWLGERVYVPSNRWPQCMLPR
jgi:hypothetical protein